MRTLFAMTMTLSFTAMAAPADSNQAVLRDEEPLKVQAELRPPTQKFTQQVLENKVRDNLFKKEEKEEKEQAKKE